jgi:serine/threonine-protein kinase
LGHPLAFLRGLARTLSRVHADGWVHADVKPANVLIGAGGVPILSDFGIAVREKEASLGGSAGFLSPERLAGAPLDPSDDIYGFGRIVEDAALKEVELGGPSTWNGFRPLAERCMAPRPSRPANGHALLELLTDPT